MPDETQLIAAAPWPSRRRFAVTPQSRSPSPGRIDFHDRPVGYKGHRARRRISAGRRSSSGSCSRALTLGGELDRLGPIVAGAAALWVLGTVDDRGALAAAAPRCRGRGCGRRCGRSALAGPCSATTRWTSRVTVVWIVGVVNAFNLMDNMDGAAGTVAAVTGARDLRLSRDAGDLALAALRRRSRRRVPRLPALQPRAPARIFLGDGGSLPIGFVIAASLMARPGRRRVGWRSLLRRRCSLGLPILDTTLVMVSRRRARASRS